MDNATITAAVNSQDIATLVDFNDWAVRSFRDWARAEGWDRAKMDACASEEYGRIVREGLDLIGFLKVRRIGSYHRLSRKARRFVWTIVATRRALAAIDPQGFRFRAR